MHDHRWATANATGKRRSDFSCYPSAVRVWNAEKFRGPCFWGCGRLALAVVLVALALGCGGRSRGIDGNGAEGGSGGTGSAPDGAAGSVGSGGSAGQGPTCPTVPAPESPIQPLGVILRNRSARPVYVPLQQCSAFFRVSAVDDEGGFPRPLVFGASPLGSGVGIPLCARAPAGCVATGVNSNGCASELLECAAGEDVALTWSGAFYSMIEFASDCLAVDSPCRAQGGAVCVAERAARAGRYRLVVPALSRLPGCDVGEQCVCQTYADGTCRHRAPYPDATDLDVELEFDYPARDPIVAVLR